MGKPLKLGPLAICLVFVQRNTKQEQCSIENIDV